MKTLSSLFLLITASFILNASEPATSVNKNLQLLHQNQSMSAGTQAISEMEQICQKHPKVWDTHYHLAYACILVSFRTASPTEAETLIKKADVALGKAEASGGDASEINTLKAFALFARIAADASNAYEYSTRGTALINQALAQNPENPRAHFLMGQNILNTPEAFGGGKERALPSFEKALDLYAKQNPASQLAPSWGEASARQMAAQCRAY